MLPEMDSGCETWCTECVGPRVWPWKQAAKVIQGSNLLWDQGPVLAVNSPSCCVSWESNPLSSSQNAHTHGSHYFVHRDNKNKTVVLYF